MNEVKKSGFATAGLVVGIVGICLSFIPVVNYVVFALGILAIVFAVVCFIKKASIGISVAAFILGVLSIVVAIIMHMLVYKAVDYAVNGMSKDLNDAVDNISSNFADITGENTEEIIEKYLDVTFGKFEVKKDTFLTETKLPVTIKNKANEKKSFSIGIEAIDKNGTRIATDIILVDGLGAGQSQNEEVFTLLTDDKIEKLKNAEFKVYEASMY